MSLNSQQSSSTIYGGTHLKVSLYTLGQLLMLPLMVRIWMRSQEDGSRSCHLSSISFCRKRTLTGTLEWVSRTMKWNRTLGPTIPAEYSSGQGQYGFHEGICCSTSWIRGARSERGTWRHETHSAMSIPQMPVPQPRSKTRGVS